MQKLVIVSCFLVLICGCSVKGMRTITDYDNEGNVVRTITMPWDARIATVEAQKQANFDYFHQEPIKITLNELQQLQTIEFHYPKTHTKYNIPKSDLEVFMDRINPANILGVGMGMSIYKQASTPSSHTVVNANGDGIYSAPDQHDNVHTSAPIRPDNSTTNTTTTDIDKEFVDGTD